MIKLVGKALKAALMAVWKSFGKPAIDNPKTPEDESDVYDPAVEAAVDALVELLLKEAQKNGKPVSRMDVAKEVQKKFPGVTLKAAYDRIDRALGRK